MSEQYFATGQCLCGNVKYTISSAPIRMGQCHCDHCRRLSGTGHSSNAFFPRILSISKVKQVAMTQQQIPVRSLRVIFVQTVVAVFLVQAVRIRTSSALRQVHWTIVHGSNQMPLSIIKESQLGISWMKVFLFLRICCQYKYKNSSSCH